NAANFIQNLPEGLVSSLAFLVRGFSVSRALWANAITAVVEGLSAIIGFAGVSQFNLNLPLLLSFAGACMMSVVASETIERWRNGEAAALSSSGFLIGLVTCGALDFLL